MGLTMMVMLQQSPTAWHEAWHEAMKEEPDIYKTLDLCGYAAPRQFPDMQLPVPGTPTPAQQSSTTSTPGQFIPEILSQSCTACMMNMCAS